MSKIQIINHALQLVNQPPINSEADLSNSSKIVNVIYEDAKAYLLSIENFSFSLNLQTLATVPDITVLPTFDVVKAMPSGALNIVRLIDSYNCIPTYRILGNYIHIKGSDTYTCEYTKVVDESVMPQHFKTAFSYYLAYQICGNLHESQSMKQYLEQEFNRYFTRSFQTDSTNSRTYVPSANQDYYSRVYDTWDGTGQEVDRWGYPLNG